MNPNVDLIGDSTRRCMLALLAVEGEVCVCEFVAALEELQPSVSRHLALLRDGGWIKSRREGTWMHYRLATLAQMGSVDARRARRRWRAARSAARGEKAPCGVRGPTAARHRTGRDERRPDAPQPPAPAVPAGRGRGVVRCLSGVDAAVGDADGAAARGSRQPPRRRTPVLLLRHPEGAAAAHRRRVRHGDDQFLLHARTNAGPPRRPRRGRGQRPGGLARRRHPVLFLLGGAAVHRLRAGGRAARHHLLVPDLGADGQRGRARAAARTLRLEDRRPLSRASALRSPSSPAG